MHTYSHILTSIYDIVDIVCVNHYCIVLLCIQSLACNYLPTMYHFLFQLNVKWQEKDDEIGTYFCEVTMEVIDSK